MMVSEAKGLTKVFPLEDGRAVKALCGVDLSVPEGQLTALVGPDGAGKTTLMRLICGLMTKTAGELAVAGIDVMWRSHQACAGSLQAACRRIPGLCERI